MASSTQAQSARTRQSLFEKLEGRQLMSVTQPSFSNFSSVAGLRATGYGDAALTANNTLQLTDGGNFESRGVFWTQKVAVNNFTSTFSFVSNKGDTADGFTFTLENYGTSARGHSGANLGYTGTQFAKSVAAAFNLYNNGGYGSTFGFASGGAIPATTTPMGSVDLHSGHIMNATLHYDGTTLSVKVVDSTNSKAVFNASEKISLSKALGGSTAYVGFTGATGVQVSTQKITSWNYTGNNTPSITKHARAVPATTTNGRTTLQVRAADPLGESSLTYTWTLVTKPGGAKNPAFKLNGRNTSKNIVTTFYKSGRYTFRCTVADRSGYTVTSNTAVVLVK